METLTKELAIRWMAHSSEIHSIESRYLEEESDIALLRGHFYFVL